MSRLTRFEQGEGEPVVLFHGAASHSGQWRALTERLSERFKVVAFDQYGYRRSPQWSEARPMLMADQVAPIFEYLSQQSGPLHLVGHSHGASLAAVCASQLSGRVKSLSLYEPNTFLTLDLNDPEQARQYQGVAQAFGDLDERMLSEVSQARFAEDLLNFWLGEGAWRELPERMRAQLCGVMRPTAREVYAALHSPFDPASLSALGERVLLMFDPHTPPLARRVSERYLSLLPKAQVKHFPGCGHLAPILHADRVNAVIEAHLRSSF